MGKGFLKGLGAPFAGAVVFLCLFSPPPGPFTRQGPVWWDVSLLLNVHGDYWVQISESSYTGEFTYGALWEGAMEKDGADFLLYHVATKDLEWRVRETARPLKTPHPLTEKDVPVRPVLNVGYILRNGKNVDFAFSVEGIPVPLSLSPSPFDLFLPSSCEHVRGRPGLSYNDFVSRGTNCVSIPEMGFEGKVYERSFLWEWNRRIWTLQEAGGARISTRHKAEVTVSVLPHH